MWSVFKIHITYELKDQSSILAYPTQKGLHKNVRETKRECEGQRERGRQRGREEGEVWSVKTKLRCKGKKMILGNLHSPTDNLGIYKE